MLNVTCALIVRGKEILLTQKDGNSSHPFQWEFPGGKKWKGETAEDCIIREIKEELELEIVILRKLNPVVHDYGFRKIELLPFLCTIRSGTIVLNEHVAFRWVRWNEVRQFELSAADKKLLSEKGNLRELEKHFGEKMDDT